MKRSTLLSNRRPAALATALFFGLMLIFHQPTTSQTIFGHVLCGSDEQVFKSLEYHDSIMYGTTNTPVYYMLDMQYNVVIDSIAFGSYYPVIYRFHSGRDGVLYAITDTFLLKKTPAGWVSTGFIPSYHGAWFEALPIAVDNQGVIYAYSHGWQQPPVLHITRYDGTTTTTQTLQNVPTYVNSCFAVDDSGAVWIGTYDGLYRYLASTFTQYFPGSWTSNVHVDNLNRIFFTRDSVVMIRDGNGFAVLDSTITLWPGYMGEPQTSRVLDTTLFIFRIDYPSMFHQLAAITTSGTQYVDLSNYPFCPDSTVAHLQFDYLGRYWLLGMASGNRGRIYVQDTTVVYSVSGRVFYDLNWNGVYDAGDIPLQSVPVLNTFTGKVSQTNALGEFTIEYHGVIGTGYRVNQFSTSPWVLTTPNPNYTGALWPNAPPVTNLDFGYNTTASPSNFDVAAFGMVFLMPPGYTSSAYLYAQNLSVFTVYNVEAWYVHDTLFGPPSPNIPPIASSGDTLYWMIDSLLPLGARIFHINLPLDSSIAIGTPFTLQLFVNHPNDTISSNDTILVNQVIMGSWDPNDKTVHPDRPEKNIAPDELLTYTIRFQNIGNAPAINVVIKDTLSTYLDLSTLHFKGASHHYSYQINSGNELQITFPNIYLPDSANFPIESIGAITYTIRPLPGLANGTVITNEAFIYFDFNAPIITNKTTSIITNSTIGVSRTHRNQVQVYPNPAGDVLWLSADAVNDGAVNRVVLYDLQGRTVFNQQPVSEGNRIRLEVSTLSPGAYFGRAHTTDGATILFRFVKSH